MHHLSLLSPVNFTQTKRSWCGFFRWGMFLI